MFDNVEVPNLPFSFPITLLRYNKMLDHFLNSYLTRAHRSLHKKERRTNYGYNIYPKNTYNEFK